MSGEVEAGVQPGERVGYIRIVRLLGRGGMGAVYLGFDERLKRQVALKAIHGRHRFEPVARARFVREARILSRLDHPHICRIYDLVEHGETDYLVLELVEGRSLREAVAAGLDRGETLEIARQLLEVLAVVHREGIVHRDLKPDNVMLSSDGEVKVLDFGVARSTDELVTAPRVPGAAVESARDGEGGPGSFATETFAGGAVGVMTELGSLVGTAGYMSPEQARGEAASPVTDVYSAGLILQELLTGRPAFDASLPPHALLLRSAEGETLPVEGLPADLTALIERLKSREPAHRPSASEALAELETIIDAPRRRRRRALVAAVWVALVALAAGATLQSVRASREAARAHRALAETRAVSGFLEQLFEAADPFAVAEGDAARGGTLTAREILDRGADAIRRRFDDQPLARARFMAVIGRIDTRLALYDRAASLLGEALELREQGLGPDATEVAESLDDLAELERLRGRFDEAGHLLERSVAIKEAALADDDAGLAESLRRLALVRDAEARYDEAEALLERAISILEERFGADALDIGVAVADLAQVRAELGRYAEADRLFRRALAIEENRLYPEHPNIAVLLDELAKLAIRRGRPDEAEPLLRRGLAIVEARLGTDHPRVGNELVNLANLLDRQGRYEEASPLYERALGIKEATLGPSHPDVGRILFDMGTLAANLGETDQADRLYDRALAITRGALGADHPTVGVMLNSTGALRVSEKRFSEAETLYRRALTVFEHAFGPEHPHVAMVLNNLGEACRLGGRLVEAEAYYRRSLEIFDEAVGEESPQSAEVARGLALTCAAGGEEREAEALLKRSLEAFERAGDRDGQGRVRADYSAFLRAAGRDAEANRLEARPAAAED